MASLAAYALLDGRQTFGGMCLTGLFTALLALALAWPLWKLRGRLLLGERRM